MSSLSTPLVLLQASLPWRPDFPSFLLGILGGLLLAAFVFVLRPLVRRGQAAAQARADARRRQEEIDLGDRFLTETSAHAASYHFLGRRAPLSSVFILPFLRRQESVAGSAGADPLRQLSLVWPELAAGVGLPAEQPLAPADLLRRARRVAVSGPPGAGKSTLLAYMTQRCTAWNSQSETSAPWNGRVPLFVHCAELGVDQLPGRPPEQVLLAALERRASRELTGRLPAYLDETIRQPAAVLFLDGLDEIPAAARAPYVEWLTRLLQRLPELQVVAAAPLRGYAPLVELDFFVVDLLPGTRGQALALVERLADALKVEQAVLPEQFWRPGQTALEMTLRFLHATRTDAPQPPWLTSLFQQYVETHLAGAPPARQKAIKALWRSVGKTLRREMPVRIAADTFSRLVRQTLPEKGNAARSDGAQLRETVRGSGLFRVWSDGAVSALTPSWRDFLAGGALARGAAETADLCLDDVDWAPVRRFYVAQKPDTRLAHELLYHHDPALRERGLFEVAGWLPEVTAEGEWQRQALKKLGQIALDRRRPMLLRIRAVATIAGTAAPGVEVLLRQLQQRPEPAVRQAATAALAAFPERSNVRYLVRFLVQEQDANVRTSVVDAVATMPWKLVESEMVSFLIGNDEVVAQAAARQLALRGGEAWRVLREGVEEPRPAVRRATIFGLALIHQPWSRRLLERMQRSDGEWFVRSAAATALEEMTRRGEEQQWNRPVPGDQTWLIYWAAEKQRAVPRGKGALAVVLDALADGNHADIQQRAAHLVAGQAWFEAAPALRRLIRTDQGTVRDSAYRALARLERAHHA